MRTVFKVWYTLWTARGPQGLCGLCSTRRHAELMVEFLLLHYPTHQQDGFEITESKLNTYVMPNGTEAVFMVMDDPEATPHAAVDPLAPRPEGPRPVAPGPRPGGPGAEATPGGGCFRA